MDSAFAIASGIMRYVFFALLAYLLVRLVVLSVSEWLYSGKQREESRETPIGSLTVTKSKRMGGVSYTMFAASVIGRSQYCNVLIPSRTIALRHAELFLRGNDVMITALHPSSKPVFVNGENIGRTDAVINNGDEIMLGIVYLIVSLSDSPLQPSDMAQSDNTAPDTEGGV